MGFKEAFEVGFEEALSVLKGEEDIVEGAENVAGRLGDSDDDDDDEDRE